MLNPRVRLSQNPAGAPAHEMKMDSNVPPLKPPPALAPALPGNEQLLAALHPLSSAQPSQALPASVALQFGVGDAVLFTGAAESAPLCGAARGPIENSSGEVKWPPIHGSNLGSIVLAGCEE